MCRRGAWSFIFMISRFRLDWILLILVLIGISTTIISTPANTDAPTCTAATRQPRRNPRHEVLPPLLALVDFRLPLHRIGIHHHSVSFASPSLHPSLATGRRRDRPLRPRHSPTCLAHPTVSSPRPPAALS